MRGASAQDGSAISIFVFDPADRSDVEKAAARNALKRCKTIKHPYVLRFIDGMEVEEGKDAGRTYIVTEPVSPLATELAEGNVPEQAVAWGLRCMAGAVAFLHKGGLLHGNINLASIFVNRAGDWKLGGFELVADPKVTGHAAFTAVRDLLPRKLLSPELSRGALNILDQCPPGVTDCWLMGITIYEVFNGELERADQLKNTASIPKALVQDYTRLLSGNAATRLPMERFAGNGFLAHEYCQMQEFLEKLNVQDAAEKDRFFQRLTDQVTTIPRAAAKYKVLPALVENLEFGGGSARILTPMLRVAKELTEEEFNAQVVPIVSKLFANNDRAMRMPLLEHLPEFSSAIPERVLNDTIFAHMSTGFTDAAPQLREMTVKTVVCIAPKLNQRSMSHLLRAFAKLQMDEEPAIRTNTTICLGKITQHIDRASRDRVLIAAFCRALQDPFAPARRAGALSLSATQAFHTAADTARKILPSIAPLTLDPDPEVRKAIFQTLAVYVAKLEAEAKRMSAREAGEEVEPEPADAMAQASTVASESVMESMTWVSSMLGKVGLATGQHEAKATVGEKQKAQGAVPGLLQPTPAAPQVPPPAVRAPAPPVTPAETSVDVADQANRPGRGTAGPMAARRADSPPPSYLRMPPPPRMPLRQRLRRDRQPGRDGRRRRRLGWQRPG